MALPGGAAGFTLTGGPYDDPAFQGMAGKLTLSVPVTHVATGERVRKTWDFSIDYNGQFSVGPLPWTDDPAFTPTGFTYTVQWQAIAWKDTPGNLTFQVPQAAGSTVDFDPLVPVTGGGQSIPLGVYSVNGHAGAVKDSDLGIGASFVVHGTNASVARPVTTMPVVWYGSASPANADSTLDVWIPTSSDGGAAALQSLQSALAAKADLAGGVVPDAELPARLQDVALRAAFVQARDVDVRSYGTVDTTGATDSSAAVLAAIADAYTKGVGVAFPGGTIRCDAQIVPGHDATTPVPLGRALRLYGVGAASSWVPLAGGTILDLRYAGADGKILLNSAGKVEIDHLALTDKGTSSAPFIMNINAHLDLHHVSIVGNPTKAGSTCDQDAIICGGTTTSATADATGQFRGYGTTIYDVHFDRIRRGVLARVYANSLRVEGLSFYNNCGSNLAADGAIVVDNGGVGFARDNTFRDILIEAINYVYGMKFLSGTARNRVEGLDCWDAGGQFLADVYFDATSTNNTVFLDGESMVAADNNGGNFITYRDGRMYGINPSFNKAVLSTVNTAGSSAAKFLNQFRGGVIIGDGTRGTTAFAVLNGAGTTVANIDQNGYIHPTSASDGTGVGLAAGTGAPNSGSGNNGDIYFRLDGGSLTTIYQRRAGAWVGIV